MTLSELAKQYEALLKCVQGHRGDLKKIEEDKDRLEQQLIDAMIDAGFPQIKLDSGLTLYTRNDVFWSAADGVSKEELISVLANNPRTTDLVSASYNANSLRSRINEIVENDEMDDDLARVLKKFEKPRIGYRS